MLHHFCYHQVAPYVAPVGSWGEYEQASVGGSCADDLNTCDTRFFVTFIKSSGGSFSDHPNTCDTIIIFIVVVNLLQSIISGSPMMRSCSIPGACTGKYLSYRKLKILVMDIFFYCFPVPHIGLLNNIDIMIMLFISTISCSLVSIP